MTEKPRIVLVNYLNTAPLLQGIQEHLAQEVELILAHPADCASIFLSGKADCGLIPVGALLGAEGWQTMTQYGIACRGPVKTVCLFGETPIASWDTIILDYQSRTSVLLAQYLLKEKGMTHIRFIPAKDDNYTSVMKGTTGGLIIGDRAIDGLSRFNHVYDLGEWWYDMTGLPFVFALWVSRMPKNEDLEANLNKALKKGLKKIDICISQYQPFYPDFDLGLYYNTNIQYRIDTATLEGLTRFKQGLAKYELNAVPAIL